MSAIGSFRATEHMEIQVLLGSMPAFISLSVYYSIQTWISYKSIAVINTLRIARLRLIVAIVASLLAFVNLISARVATLQAMTGGVTWTELRGDRKLWWSRSWSGYEAHLVSTVSENLFFLMLAFFSMTFVSEFKGFNLHNGEIKFVLGSLRYSSVTPTAWVSVVWLLTRHQLCPLNLRSLIQCHTYFDQWFISTNKCNLFFARLIGLIANESTLCDSLREW